MFRYGLAGIPLSSKGRTLKDALEDVHRLGLNALEIQLFRVNVQEGFGVNYVGQKPKEIEDSLIIDVQRPDSDGNYTSIGIEEEIEEDDILYNLFWTLVKSYKELNLLGKMAKELDIKISLHTPYYMDLVGTSEFTDRFMDYIIWGGILANEIDADIVVNHIGPYDSKIGKKKSLQQAISNIKKIQKTYKKLKLKPKLGFESAGKQKILGSLNELLTISKEVKNVLPIVNFAHYQARENGILKSQSDFKHVFDKVSDVMNKKYYMHFSGVKFESGNTMQLSPLKKGDIKFELLADCILENEYDVTIISSSPLLEHDAQYMQVIMDRRFLSVAKKKST